MQKVTLNKDNLIISPLTNQEVAKEIEVSDEMFAQILTTEQFFTWKYNEIDGSLTKICIDLVSYYKNLRQLQCFSLLDNRSKFWYDSLTSDQYQELQAWYQAWLDAPATHIIPKKPEWLK